MKSPRAAATSVVAARVGVTCPACLRPVLLTLGLPDIPPSLLVGEVEARTTNALWLHLTHGCAAAQAGGDGRPHARSL